MDLMYMQPPPSPSHWKWKRNAKHFKVKYFGSETSPSNFRKSDPTRRI